MDRTLSSAAIDPLNNRSQTYRHLAFFQSHSIIEYNEKASWPTLSQLRIHLLLKLPVSIMCETPSIRV